MTQNKAKQLLLFTLALMIVLALSIMVSSLSRKDIYDGKGSPSGQEIAGGMPIFTEANNGESFTLMRGDSFKLILRENPSTGYSWTIDQSTSENIVLISQEYVPEQRDHDRLGHGGRRDMVFTAQKKGTAVLVLHLSRSWEQGDKYLESFTLHFEILD
ncbi:MAG: protease inhibitor I42 family protein [bacterium]